MWEAEYSTWGNTAKVSYKQRDDIIQEDLAFQPLRFQGQYFDAETGLHYNRFRYYDPDIGRFISQDPIGLLGGTNLYQYAPNPVGWVDPLGLALIKNKAEGMRREAEVLEELKKEHPNARIEQESFLRDENGKSVKDPVTGTKRRVDFAVIENGKAKTVEVTSLTANKDEQMAKEKRIIEQDGKYIKNRETKEMVPVEGVCEIVRKK